MGKADWYLAECYTLKQYDGSRTPGFHFREIKLKCEFCFKSTLAKCRVVQNSIVGLFNFYIERDGNNAVFTQNNWTTEQECIILDFSLNSQGDHQN